MELDSSFARHCSFWKEICKNFSYIMCLCFPMKKMLMFDLLLILVILVHMYKNKKDMKILKILLFNQNKISKAIGVKVVISHYFWTTTNNFRSDKGVKMIWNGTKCNAWHWPIIYTNTSVLTSAEVYGIIRFFLQKCTCITYRVKTAFELSITFYFMSSQ